MSLFKSSMDHYCMSHITSCSYMKESSLLQPVNALCDHRQKLVIKKDSFPTKMKVTESKGNYIAKNEVRVDLDGAVKNI